VLRLDSRARAACAAAAFAAFGGAFADAPQRAAGEAAAPGDGAPAVRALEPDARGARLAIVPLRRDPFAAPRPAATPRSASSSTARRTPSPPLPVLPPNAGAPPFPFVLAPRALVSPAPPVRALVSAVVTGPRPAALIVDGGGTRLVTVGDRVGAATIAAITADGVRLRDGTVIHVAPPDRTRGSTGGL